MFIVAARVCGSNWTGNNCLWACVSVLKKALLSVSKFTSVLLYLFPLVKMNIVALNKGRDELGYGHKLGSN